MSDLKNDASYCVGLSTPSATSQVTVLQRMPVGSIWKLFIPQDLAYGANPRPAEPFMALVFEVELLAAR